MSSNKWLAEQHIYLQDYRRHSVDVSQKKEWPLAGLYKYNGRQTELFIRNGLMVDRLTGPRLMSSWRTWDWC